MTYITINPALDNISLKLYYALALKHLNLDRVADK